MRLALIADVHANLQALRSVLRAVTEHRPERLLCLGDTVAYNANPNECIGLLRRFCDASVAGNHDRDVIGGEVVIGTSSVARLSQEWTKGQLTEECVSWLLELPNKLVEPGEYIAVHGCYLNTHHINGYVTQTMLEPNLRAIANNQDWPKLGFCGHTHVPGLAFLQDDKVSQKREPGERLDWPADAAAILINPGSVGQPRDGDPRASYAIVDTTERWVMIHRLHYDVEGAILALQQAGLPEALGLRLREGR
jgi:diadenosine tetraphosphatase ApaH/serine/threonine PP2A family protein phosphatase